MLRKQQKPPSSISNYRLGTTHSWIKVPKLVNSALALPVAVVQCWQFCLC